MLSLEVAETVELINYYVPGLKPSFLALDLPLNLDAQLIDSAQMKQLKELMVQFNQAQEAEQKALFITMMELVA